MKIKKILLNNVKSHLKTQIYLGEGMSFIKGNNGSGKSTILEAIGFALFDAIPGGKTKGSSYVKYFKSDLTEEDEGNVEVTVEAEDGNLYTIVRKFGRYADWYIQDDVSGETFLLSSSNKKNSYSNLKKVLSLKTNLELPKVFLDIIGANQGDLNSIFLKTPKERSEIFNRIFGVEEYGMVDERVRVLANNIKSKRMLFANSIEMLKKNIQDMGDVKTEILVLKKEIELSIQNINSKKRRKEELSKDVQKLEDMVERIRTMEKKQMKCEAELDKIKTLAEQLKKYINEAYKARQVMEEVREGYEVYLKGEKKREEYEKRIRSLEALSKKREDLEKQHRRLLEEKERKKLSLSTSLHHLREEIKLKDEKITLTEGILERETDRLDIERSSFEEKNDMLNVLERDMKSMQMRYKSAEEEMREAMIRKRERLKTELNRFLKYEEYMKEGKCPILDVSCDRIAYASGWGEKIDALREDIDVLDRKINGEVEISEDMKVLKMDMKDVLTKVEEICHQKVTETNIFDQMTLWRAKSTKEIEKLEYKIDELKRQKKGLYEERKKIKIEYEEKKKRLCEEENAMGKINELKRKLELLEGETKVLSELREGKMKVSDQMKRFRSAYETYIKMEEKAKNIGELEIELASKEKDIETKRKLLSELQYDLSQMRDSFSKEELEKEIEEKSKLDEELGGLEAALKKDSDRMSDLESKYRKLMEMEKELEENKKKLMDYDNALKILQVIRKDVLKHAPQEIAKRFINRISVKATELYHSMTDRNDFIKCNANENYAITFLHKENGKFKEREFRQLSGGEKTVVAVALRLAMISTLTNLNVVFFDEPTANLDVDMRIKLADLLSKAVEQVDQMMVISHDSAFDHVTDTLIELEKENGETVVKVY